jgi:ATP-binding cassette, subfamily B, bacterial PglK
LFRYAFTIISEYLIVKFSKNWEINLIQKLLKHQFGKPWIDVLKTHEPLIKNITVDIPVFVQQGIVGVMNLSKGLVILIGIFAFLIYEKGLMTIFSIIGFGIIFYFLLKISKNFLAKVSKNSNYRSIIKFNLTNEITNGFKEIKIQNIKDYFLKEYKKNEKSIAILDITRKICVILPKIIIELISVVVLLSIAYLNNDNAKELIPFLGLLTFIIYRTQPVMASVASIGASLQLYEMQIYNGVKILNSSLELDNQIENEKLEIDGFDIQEDSEVELKNLNFSYNKDVNNENIFEDLNISLKFGKIYGLVGKNGSGKSTFADLITGLLKPKTGEIYFDNKNINEFIYSWHSSISYLSQFFYLFDDTIKNNITLGKRINNKYSEEKYQRAIRISNLQDELDKFTDKDSTFLTNSGKFLSGGQKQKIAIARLIYKGSKIIILDEPTASLDQVSSELMMKMLQELKKDKLIIIISHSSKILNECDEILKIDKKNIIISNK